MTGKVPEGLIAPLPPEVALIVGSTINELLVPMWVPSVAVMVTPEPALVTLTVADPTPFTKASITLGLIDSAQDKDGVPL